MAARTKAKQKQPAKVTEARTGVDRLIAAVRRLGPIPLPDVTRVLSAVLMESLGDLDYESVALNLCVTDGGRRMVPFMNFYCPCDAG